MGKAKISPDEARTGFFTVAGVAGYFRKEDAERIAEQMSTEEPKKAKDKPEEKPEEKKE